MRDLPPPLPPGERTVGQLIGESIRAYGNDFWRLIPLGVPYAVVEQACAHRSALAQMLVYLIAAPFITAAYVWACSVVYQEKPTLRAFLVGLLIYLPFPFLRRFFILPGVAWFAFIGLAVPACLVERLGFRRSLARGRELGRADYVHSLGGLAALVVVVGIASGALQTLLHSQSDNGLRAALVLADLVLSPLLYLGGALLYQDQAARVGSSPNADVHPPLDLDPAGRADAEGKP